MASLMERAAAGPRIGSLCTGYGGLDMAAQQVFDGSVAWVSDIDPGACRIIGHRMPCVPNIGDLTTAPWADLEPVDIVTGGYPCQPFSHAGLRKGTEDERHIWPYIATALRVLRPRIAVFENVAGHLRLGFDTVLADLAALGFDAEWRIVRASDVGAPHQRARLFIVATAADAPHVGHERGRSARGRRNGFADRRLSASHPDRGGQSRYPECHGGTQDGQPERECGLDADGRDVRGEASWGEFGPGIHRWEYIIGRRAPGATDDRGRLSPLFVEWMMGLPPATSPKCRG